MSITDVSSLAIKFLDKTKTKTKKKELTFPGDGEALASQIREDGLQLLAQVYEIRRDVVVNAESAHFRGTRVLVHQIHLETQLSHRQQRSFRFYGR